MQKSTLHQIQSLRSVVQSLSGITNPALEDEQATDVKHILSALDLLQKRTLHANFFHKGEEDRMQTLHDLTSPINGIIGYLYILEQEYSAPLSPNQRQLVKQIDKQINQLYQHISRYFLHPQTDI